ncbi:hypothetical protein D9613_001185 [Agrocybe pediades]|uniref:Uncharacterized protein n=1 Tax=Agrocybe pediades TaxID=84607 RepID=A0A8H4VUH1_9AGAR|nr:hypothetical protein D9613_001185 [Agrocybe pediades]
MVVAGNPLILFPITQEVRIDDYIKAYTTTGRPPPPVPLEPADSDQRKLLGLPPLFKPTPFKVNEVTGTVELLPQPCTDPKDVPDAQEFSVRKVDSERYHSISCMLEYANFSFEELRVLAYSRGHKLPPTPVKMDPFVIPSSTSSTSTASTSAAPHGIRTGIYNTGSLNSSTAATGEQYQNICMRDEFKFHSPEELRIAYLLHGRELNSAQILSTASPALPAPTSSALTTTTTGLSGLGHLLTPATPSSVAPPAVYAKPNLPTFTFGLR